MQSSQDPTPETFARTAPRRGATFRTFLSEMICELAKLPPSAFTF